jgi:hypothetical protein
VACAGDRRTWRSADPFHIAIKTGLALRLTLQQPLRQTEAASRLIADLLGVRIRIPDRTTFSRPGGGLRMLPKRVMRDVPLPAFANSAFRHVGYRTVRTLRSDRNEQRHRLLRGRVEVLRDVLRRHRPAKKKALDFLTVIPS